VTALEIAGAPGASRLLGLVPLRRGAPVSRSNLQQAVRVLFRSGRFARVAALLAPGPSSGVRVILLVEPRRTVATLSFVGARSLDEATLRKAADLPSGTEYSPARLDRAARGIALAYFRAGWRKAAVRWDASPVGEQAAIDFSVSEDDPTTLVRVEFPGDRGLTEPELHAAMDLPPGALLDVDRVERGLAQVRLRLRDRQFFRARVGRPRVEAADERGVVEVPMEAGPRFRLQVRGNRTFDADTLLSYLGYTGAEPLVPLLQRTLAERMRGFYELAGHPEARVVARETDAPPPGAEEPGGIPQDPGPLRLAEPAPAEQPPPPVPTSAARLVTFVVNEGPTVRVTRRVFPGAVHFPQPELERRVDSALEDAVPDVLLGGREEALLQTTHTGGDPVVPARARPRVVPREIFAAAPYKAACAHLVNLYKSEGYLDAEVGPARLDVGTGTVVVPVAEGPRSSIGEVRVAGTDAVPEAEVRRAVAVKPGDPLSFFAIEESRAAVQQLYLTRGHLFVRVEDEEDPEPGSDPPRAAVTLRVDEGPVVKVDRVEIKGLLRTDPALVRGVLTLGEGDPVTPQACQESVRNILKLGLFVSASVEPADPELPAADKALVVEVREKPSIAAEAKGGLSLADGPRVSGQLQWANVGGRNRTVALAAALNWPVFRYLWGCADCELPNDSLERRIRAGISAPQFRGAGLTPVDLRADLVHENLLRPAYHLTKYALLGSVDGLGRTKLGPFETGALLQVEFERDKFELLQQGAELGPTIADKRAGLLPQGSILLVSLRPSLTLDARDDKLNPTRGVLASISADLARSLVPSEPPPCSAGAVCEQPFDIALVRTLANAQAWVPLYRPARVTLSLAGRVGGILRGEGTKVIGTKRFFLGGTQSLRSFNEDDLVPQDVREAAHRSEDLCNSLLTRTACDEQAMRRASGRLPTSSGGEFVLLGRAELWFALGGTADAGVFLDAGNLWLDPERVDPRVLRYAAGAGLRFPLPIGPAAFAAGFNLQPDALVGEPTFRLHLSVGM